MNELTVSEIGESLDVSSYNHAIVQINLAFLLKLLNRYDVLTELSLDIGDSREMKPDVCIYPKRGLSRPRDILRMVEMPMLAIEILSPEQGTDEILEKFESYFKMSIQSCWLVDPAIEVVAVYQTMNKHSVFNAQEVVDEVLGIRLPLVQIFE